jgi:hypothetical protein
VRHSVSRAAADSGESLARADSTTDQWVVTNQASEAGGVKLSLPLRGIVNLRWPEANDRLARLRVTELLPRQPLHSLGIVAQRVNSSAQLAAHVLSLLDLVVLFQDTPAHPLILLDERQIPNANEEDDRNKTKKDYDPVQLVPDAEVNFHNLESIRPGLARQVINLLPGD